MACYALRVMGYGWMIAAAIALTWGFSAVWIRSGFGAAADVLSWEIVSLALVPVGVLLLAASWARKRYGVWDEDDESES